VPTTLSFNRQHSYAGNEHQGIVIPVHLILGERRTKVLAKIDTGATYCIFNRGYGEALDLNIESGHRIAIRTANGEFNAFGHELTINCLDYEVHSMVYFAEHQGFHRDVLGRNGWIHNFRLGIVDYDSLLYLSQHDE
jgi:predicted aspartyl protease